MVNINKAINMIRKANQEEKEKTEKMETEAMGYLDMQDFWGSK